MDLSVTVGRWDVFLLVLFRVAAMVMVAPALGARGVPVQVKVGLSVLLAIVLTPLQEVPGPIFTDWLSIATSVAREVVIGLLLGFVATLLFSAVHMAAQVIGVQIGYGFSNVMDPLSAQNSSFLETLYNLMAIVVFLSLGGHHALIVGLSQSFDMAPLGGPGLGPIVGERIVALSSMAFAIGLRMAMPIVGTMLLVDSATALVVRSIPQMNVFVVGLPVKMVVGFLTLVGLTPLFVSGIAELTRSVGSAVSGVLQ
ncbi:MAG: flagellar biosynthetic protein FliR [Sphingomonadaceae bacterium]